MSELRLLLMRAGEHTAALHELDGTQAASGPRPPRAAGDLTDDVARPGDLPAQRWGVVAPQGARGDAMLGAVAPLIALREAQQGAPAIRYRVPAGLDMVRARGWLRRIYLHERVLPEDRPRYLLVLGDLDEVSLALQQALSAIAFVGRLGFTQLEAFEAYAAKVLRWKTAETMPGAAALYWSADHDAATNLGHAKLMQPALERQQDRRDKGDPSLRDARGLHHLLEAAEVPAATLLTVSHGLGPPREGWSDAQQRALQGTICLDAKARFTAEAVRDTPFLPGGAWLMFACFGAGVPESSAYAPWLKRLGHRSGARAVQAGLPVDGRPFLAAVPQAALANPDGPLAVLGHVDLAWSYGFLDEDQGSRASRFDAVLRAFAQGGRAGVAMHTLARRGLRVGADLTLLYDRQEEEELRGRHATVDPQRKGELWMTYHDLTGYVLLGDPAARLSVPGPEAAASVLAKTVSAPVVTAATAQAPDTLALEDAVLAVLTHAVSLKRAARDVGLEPERLKELARAYQAAGRAALTAS